jgi:hypothetical protein
MTDRDAHELVTLLKAHTPFEAHALAAVLRDADIEAFVFDSAYAGFGIPLAPGKASVPVQVRRRDRERARAAIEENASDSIDIDWNDIDLGQRADDLPLRRPGRMPIPARIALAVISLIILAALVAGALALLMP